MKRELHAIRGIDEEVYRRFREKTLQERMKVGQAVTLAMKEWIKKDEKREEPNPKNLLKIKPIKVGKKKVRWSEEIDEFLYGKET